jgi:Carboxypeptidase regulatory-like domain
MTSVRSGKSILLFAALLFPSPLSAQSSGGAQIAGVVTDPSGALIANAEVKATRLDTQEVRTTASTPSGTYVLPNLPVGSYVLEVTSHGFGRYRNNGIVLEVGNAVTINVTLPVGDITQTVQVSADAEMVQTQETSVSEVIDQRRIIDLPLNGRQATDLILLAGGTATDPAASFGGGNAPAAGTWRNTATT